MADSSPSPSALADLQASRELNKRIIEALPGGIVHVSVDGAIQTANTEALRILGMSYDQLTDRYTQDFAPETIWESGETCSPEAYPVTKALITGEAQPPATIGLRHATGGISWAVFTAVPVKDPSTDAVTGAVVTFLDVTASKQTMLALRESEARLRSVVDSAPSTILTTTLEGKVLFINRSSTPGLPAGSVVGMSIFDFVDADQVDTVRQCMQRVAHSGEIDGYELPVRNEASTTHYSVRVGPIETEGKIAALSFVATDITMIKELQSRVAMSDRLASIGTLAAGVAHEINNPLTYLLLSLRRAAEPESNGDDSSVLAASIEDATDAAQRIHKIVKELAIFARPGSDKLVAVDIGQTMENAVKMATIETRYRARLIRDYRPTPPVLADSARLTQVFLNLLLNAAQAIDEGDVDSNCITIRIRPQATGAASVDIIDTGCGIPAELLPHIFEPFVTSKGVGKGTGLGLHICHNIVTSFGGAIEVQSSPREGTTFTITLPAAAGVVPASIVPPVHAQPRTSGLPILIVDDEPAIRESLTMLLAEHEVTVASSGRDAVALLAHANFAAIFCDLIMPDMTGMDVHDFVLRERPDLASALVFMTGGAFTKRAKAFVETLDRPVLAKPFSPEDVDAILETLSASLGE